MGRCWCGICVHALCRGFTHLQIHGMATYEGLGDSQAWRSCGALVVATFLVRIRKVHGAQQRGVGQLGLLHGLKEGRRVGKSGMQIEDGKW